MASGDRINLVLVDFIFTDNKYNSVKIIKNINNKFIEISILEFKCEWSQRGHPLVSSGQAGIANRVTHYRSIPRVNFIDEIRRHAHQNSC